MSEKQIEELEIDLARCRAGIDYLITHKLQLKAALAAAVSSLRSGEPLHEDGSCETCKLILAALEIEPK